METLDIKLDTWILYIEFYISDIKYSALAVLRYIVLPILATKNVIVTVLNICTKELQQLHLEFCKDSSYNVISCIYFPSFIFSS